MELTRITAIVRCHQLEALENRLKGSDVPGITVDRVKGFGEYADFMSRDWMCDYARVEIIADRRRAARLIDAIIEVVHTGTPGDGIIYMAPVDRLYRIRDHHVVRSAESLCPMCRASARLKQRKRRQATARPPCKPERVMTVNRPNRVEVGPTLTVARDPLTGVQIRIGVMGSAGGALDESVAARCQDLGRAIAERGCCLLTGACPGLPHEVVCAAKHAGGHVVGISPASSLKEHVETFGSPYHEYDVLVFTGLGLMGRELVNIHSSFAWRAPFSEWKHAYIGTILEVTPTSDRMGGLPSCVIMLTADVLGAQGTSTPRRLTNVNAARSREQKTSR